MAEAEKVPKVMLKSGHKMPMVGFGTVLAPAEGFASILTDAISVGYRHFDTSSVNGTEEAIGQARSFCCS